MRFIDGKMKIVKRLNILFALLLFTGATEASQPLDLLLEWSRSSEAAVLRQGRPLTAQEMALARRLGVRRPERVRIRVAAAIPGPTDPALARIAAQKGLGADDTVGLTFGHGITLRADRADSRALLRHELTHVAQYERLGFAGFLRRYAAEIERLGYAGSPLENEARRAEFRSR